MRTLVNRYPRIFGAIVLAIGVVMTVQQHIEAHAGRGYLPKVAFFSPVFAVVGGYLAVFGIERDDEGRPSRGYITGVFIATALGALGGVLFRMSLP